MPAQLPLGIRLHDHAVFDSYYPGPNRAAAHAAAAIAAGGGEPLLYLWGAAGVGKSHLLQAACHAGAAAGRAVAYLPMASGARLSPEGLEGLEGLALVCLDGLDRVAGDPLWEEALFDLINRVREAGGRLLVAATVAPAKLGVRLADLRSRLAGGLVFQLRALDDEAKLAALQMRAARRGVRLSGEVGRYLMRRAPRDMGSLFALLERLDDASLRAQRRLTIPFVREVMGWR